jgi:hypothetical protein
MTEQLRNGLLFLFVYFCKGSIVTYMRKILLLLFLISVCTSYDLSAQSVKPLRVEIATKEDSDPFTMINCSEMGALVFFQTVQEVGVDSVVWSFFMFDKNLRESWRKGIGLGENYRYINNSHLANDSLIYLLFQNPRQTEGKNIVILTVNVINGIVLEVKGLISAKSKIDHFAVDDNYAFITLTKSNDKIELIRMSMKESDIRQFSLPDNNNSSILDLKLNSVNKQVGIVIKIYDSRTTSSMELMSFSYNGPLLDSIVFEKLKTNRSFNTAEIVFSGFGKGNILGVYSNSLSRPKSPNLNEDQNPPSSGYYIAGFDNGNSLYVNYYNFSEFRDFFRFINGDDAVRLKKKIVNKSKNEEGQEGDLNYHFLVHPVIHHDSSFVMVGEAYYPEYHTVTNMMYDYYGRPMPTSYSVFDGFRYTSAFIASFNNLGAMRWSNGMEMQGILTNFLNKKFTCTFDGVNAVLIYNSGGELTAKTIRGNEVLDQNTNVPLAMLHVNDKVVKEYLSSIEPWYGDFFIASGYHSIRNNDLPDSRRTVFYLNKIAYR